MKRTLKGSFVLGVTAGYFHNNDGDNNLSEVAEAVKSLAAELMEESGIYISGSLKPVRVVYHDDWGCPRGGEQCYEFIATANPTFVADMAAWQDAFVALAKAIKARFQQSTIMVDFVEAQCLYLAD